MTTYTAITDTETGFEKPVTISLIRRLRDNPLAIQEGDATAPSIYTGIAAKHAGGGIGSTHMMVRAVAGASATVSVGGVYAGSELRFSGSDDGTGGVSASGTWRALGNASEKTVGGTSYSYATIFIRIS